MSFLRHFYTALDYEHNTIAMGLNGRALDKHISMSHDPRGKLKGPLPDDDSHPLVTLSVLGLFGIFTWLYLLGVQQRRAHEPGYVPKVFKARFMQRFEFVKKLRQIQQEDEPNQVSAVMEEDSDAAASPADVEQEDVPVEVAEVVEQ